MTAANTNSDGTGNIGTPTMYVLFTADATNGSYVEFVRFMVVGNSAGASSAATVARVYASSITSGATSSANTYLVGEVAIPAATSDSATAAGNWFDFPLGFRLPAGWTILGSLGTAASANVGIRGTVFGGDY